VNNNDYDFWHEDLVRRFDESVETAKSSQHTHETNQIPLRPTIFYHIFSSTAVERVVHQYIVSNIPAPPPARRFL